MRKLISAVAVMLVAGFALAADENREYADTTGHGGVVGWKPVSGTPVLVADDIGGDLGTEGAGVQDPTIAKFSLDPLSSTELTIYNAVKTTHPGNWYQMQLGKQAYTKGSFMFKSAGPTGSGENCATMNVYGWNGPGRPDNGTVGVLIGTAIIGDAFVEINPLPQSWKIQILTSRGTVYVSARLSK